MSDYKRAPTCNFVDAQCAAMTRAGRRCTGRWNTSVPCLFAWDAVTGDGTDGPHVVLCHRHRGFVFSVAIKGGARIAVVHGGWLGAANRYGNGTAVYASPTGRRPARWWWARRRAATCVEHRDQPRRDAA